MASATGSVDERRGEGVLPRSVELASGAGGWMERGALVGTGMP